MDIHILLFLLHHPFKASKQLTFQLIIIFSYQIKVLTLHSKYDIMIHKFWTKGVCYLYISLSSRKKIMYNSILARSFSRLEQKRLGYGAFICSLFVLLFLCSLLKPHFGLLRPTCKLFHLLLNFTVFNSVAINSLNWAKLLVTFQTYNLVHLGPEPHISYNLVILLVLRL